MSSRKSIRARRLTAPLPAEIFFFVSVSVRVHPRSRQKGAPRWRKYWVWASPIGRHCAANEGLTSVFKRTLTAPNVEARYKDPANWPDELIAELGNDDGLSAANRCGERFGNDFRAIRKILDDSIRISSSSGATTSTRISARNRPGFLPARLRRRFRAQALGNGNGGKPNRWDEPGDWRLPLHGHREAAKYLTTGLIERGIDMAYAYKPLHDPMAHAFTNTLVISRLGPEGVPVPGDPVRGQLLRAKPAARQGRSGAPL